MTGSRLFSPRWLAAGGVAVLAGVLGLAMMLQNSGSACAAPPSTSAKKGIATWFNPNGSKGSCNYPSLPADDMYVALGRDQFTSAAACGTYIDVTGPKGKARVKVTDACGDCKSGHLDLSHTAYRKIAGDGGLADITYKTVKNAPVPGSLAVHVLADSSQYYLGVLIDNHSNQLTSVQVAGKGRDFRNAVRQDWGYWVLESGAGPAPLRIKVSDVYGHTVTVSGIKISSGRWQPTGVSLTGAPIVKITKTAKATTKPAATKKPPSKKPTATPSVSFSTPALTDPIPPPAALEAPTPVDLAAAPSCE
ncbi:MAG: expansin EXLX1 family cellulose-binding protein [Actinoplanes sp.]